MAVEKFSISLPEELVTSIDEIAAQEGLTRSAIIREVTTEYIVKRTSETHEKERRARIDGVIVGFERIAERWGSDERSVADVLQEMRHAEEGLGD